MSDLEFITLFFVALLALWPLLLLGVLAFTLGCMALLSLYLLVRGFVRDELELWYINRRASEVVQEAREMVHDRTSGATA
jgi:hypothetical protein